ncbi:MAG: hypothetical protein AAGD07_08605 [Planctomycetota bacterium]
MISHRLFLVTVTIAALASTLSAGSPTGWSPIVVPRGSLRAQLDVMPIERRPGRLFHVYGNTVRLIDQGDPLHHPVRRIVLGTDCLRDEGIPRR